MTEGAHHSGVEHICSPLITREHDVPLLYLDQFHWIGLARAAAGSAADGYSGLLRLLRTATQARVLTVPLSAANYMELVGVASHRQRCEVAAVMAELSRVTALPSRPTVIRLELEAVLDAVVGPRSSPLQPVPLVGRGWRHAFGVDPLNPLAKSTRDILEPLRLLRPMPDAAFEAEVAAADEWAELTMLAGPSSDDDLEVLQRNGFVQFTAQEGQQKRADQEQWLSDYMKSEAESRWRRGRLRDVVTARYMKFEAGEALALGLMDRGATADALPDNRDAIRGLVDAMPSADVHVSIQVAMHRNSESSWKRNDFFDIDALAVAVPYCDAVATERHRANDLRAQGCTKRFGAEVLASLSDLVAYVAEAARGTA